MEKEIVLINKHHIPFTINFVGVFPNNKSAVPNGKYYLTEREYEWLTFNQPYLFEKNILALEGAEEVVEAKTKTGVDGAKFFDQHVNKAKSQAAKIESLDEVNALIDYANDNEIDNKAVDALIKRANELSE